MNRITFTATFAITLALLGCGGEPEITASLGVPDVQAAQVALTPSFDLSNLFDPELGKRIAIQEIIINVAELRLLGLDPHLPSGGLPLIESERLVSSSLSKLGENFPIPSDLMRDDLAIYVRIQPSMELGSASALVRGELYGSEEQARAAAQLAKSALSSEVDGESGAVDPDGEPAMKGDEAVDPDGEPAMPREGAVDPDGEPADCPKGAICSGLQNAVVVGSVSFELRGIEAADLILEFFANRGLDAIVNVPAGKWFTPEVVQRLEEALFTQAASTEDDGREETIVIEEDPAKAKALARQNSNEEAEDERAEDYSIEQSHGFDPRNSRPDR